MLYTKETKQVRNAFVPIVHKLIMDWQTFFISCVNIGFLELHMKHYLNLNSVYKVILDCIIYRAYITKYLSWVIFVKSSVSSLLCTYFLNV